MISDDNSDGHDVPMEVVRQILIHLPVKSLIRFTCVCKTWLNLIRHDHEFAISHYLLRTTKQSRLMDNAECIVEYPSTSRKVRGSKICEEVMRLSIYSITEKKTFRLVKKIECGPSLNVTYSNICHGVFCVYVSASDRGDTILICNPATSEVVPIPSSIKVSFHSQLKLGLGFDPINNDYKIIMIVRSPFNKWLVDVYSVRDGGWHLVRDTSVLNCLRCLVGQTTLNDDGAILNWLGCRQSSSHETSLVSLDIVDEFFTIKSLPECPCHSRKHLLVSSTQCLACLVCSPYPCLYPIGGLKMFNGSEVWVLKDSIDRSCTVWLTHVSFGFPNHEMVVWPLEIWINDNETFVYVPQKTGGPTELFCYDRRTQDLRRTGRLGGSGRCCSGYSESLVSIKGLISSSSSSSDDKYQGHEDDGGPVCFIREVGRKNDDIRWSYSFKLLN